MLRLIVYKLSYWGIRLSTFPLSLLSYGHLHKLCKWATPFLFPLLTGYRKRALSNLALAKTLSLTSEQILQIAKGSLTNLLITALEYPKLAKDPHLEKLVHCVNPDTAAEIIQKGKGVIFFCAHQANWELLFLEGTLRMPGTAIGRSVKNRYLYNWVLNIRERFGGKIIPPKNALKESLRALKQGRFVGIVGDQGMPDSGFSCPFLGRLAWTSPLPALLSYRTNTPLFFATTQRELGHYKIIYSDPIYPDLSKESEEEIPHLMKKLLHLLEKSIEKRPQEWLWQHNRWKQKLPGNLKKTFRQDAIAIILPLDPAKAKPFIQTLTLFRKIYPTEWLMLFIPSSLAKEVPITVDELRICTSEQDLFVVHFGPKLVFNFSGLDALKTHFLKLSAFHVFNLKDLARLSHASENEDISTLLIGATGYAL